MSRQDVTTQTVMGTRGFNDTAGEFVTDVTGDLRWARERERKGKWVVLRTWPEPGQGGLCTCTLGAKRCSRTKENKETYKVSQLVLYAVKCESGDA